MRSSSSTGTCRSRTSEIILDAMTEQAIRSAVWDSVWKPVAGTYDEEFIVVRVPTGQLTVLDVWKLKPPIPRLVYVSYEAPNRLRIERTTWSSGPGDEK